MTSPPSTSQDHILLVEGQDEKHVIEHLCARHQLTPTFCILDKEGITKLLPSISLEIKAPERRAVGIVVDANEDLNGRWEAITHRLQKESIQVPESPDPSGTILPSKPRIGIWLMPNNMVAGELEDFVEEMIRDDDPIWPRSQSYIEGIRESDRRFLESKIKRAKIHAWLAARENPRKMGSAIHAGDLDPTGNLCQHFIDWLKSLFKEEI